MYYVEKKIACTIKGKKNYSEVLCLTYLLHIGLMKVHSVYINFQTSNIWTCLLIFQGSRGIGDSSIKPVQRCEVPSWMCIHSSSIRDHYDIRGLQPPSKPKSSSCLVIIVFRLVLRLVSTKKLICSFCRTTFRYLLQWWNLEPLLMSKRRELIISCRQSQICWLLTSNISQAGK